MENETIESQTVDLSEEELDLATGGAAWLPASVSTNVASYWQNQSALSTRYVMMLYPTRFVAR